MANNFKVGFYYHVDPDGKNKLEFANIAERRSFAVCTGRREEEVAGNRRDQSKSPPHTANDRLSAGSANPDFFIAIRIYMMVEASPELIRNQLSLIRPQ